MFASLADLEDDDVWMTLVNAAHQGRKTSVSESSSNDPGWRSWTTVSSLMAYPSFVEKGDFGPC